jgi:putative membrane protein
MAALTAGQLGVLLPVLAAGSQLLQTFVGERGERGQDAIDLLPGGAMGWILAGAALLAVAWLLSTAGVVVAFHAFTVARDEGRLRVRRGLLQRRETTIPVERVRAVSLVEGVLRRPFGLATLRIEVIGHAAEPTAAQTLFPLLRRDEARAMLDALLPELADNPDGLERPPARALRRYVLPWALLPLPLLYFTPWALLLAPLGAAYGVARHRAAGWRLADGRLAVRSLLLARVTVLAPAVNR